MSPSPDPFSACETLQAGPIRGDVGDGGLVALRKEDRDAVAGPQALRRVHV